MSYELAGVLLTVVLNMVYVAYKFGKIEEKILELVKKQDKHNNLIERQYKTESEIEVLYEKIEVANHRIEDLERKQ